MQVEVNRRLKYIPDLYTNPGYITGPSLKSSGVVQLRATFIVLKII